jgi:hypothetical protein
MCILQSPNETIVKINRSGNLGQPFKDFLFFFHFDSNLKYTFIFLSTNIKICCELPIGKFLYEFLDIQYIKIKTWKTTILNI